MKIQLLFVAIALPLIFGGTACSHGRNEGGVIVRVKTPDEHSGWLGVSIQDMTRRLAKAMDVKTSEGALVNSVVDESPAEEAGVKDEDIIVEVDGKKITDADDLREVVRAITPGTKVNVVVMRKDEKKTLATTIRKQPRSRSYSYSYTPPSIPRIPRMPRRPMDIHIFSNISHLGLTISSLNKQLGKYFDAPDGKGVLVQEVEEDSKAEKAGFQAGDIIIRIGKETIQNVDDVTDALGDYKEGEKADVEVIRKGTKKTLAFEVPDLDRRHRHLGFAPDDDSWNEFDLDLPDMEMDHNGHNTLKNDLKKLELELRGLGREIQTKAKKLQEDLKARFSQVKS